LEKKGEFLKLLKLDVAKTAIKYWANNLLMKDPSKLAPFELLSSTSLYIPTGSEPVEFTYEGKNMGDRMPIAVVQKGSFDNLLHYIWTRDMKTFGSGM